MKMRLKLIRWWRKGLLKRTLIPSTLRKLPASYKADDLEKIRQFCAKCKWHGDLLIYRYMSECTYKEVITDLEGNDLQISKTARLKIKRLIEDGLL